MINLMLGDCLERMKEIPDSSVDLTVTSPPYDNLRTYNNTLDWGEHVWKPVLRELFRVTKQGGVVVWIVNDATIKGSETGTSFKQALFFMGCGFRLHDTMLYMKNQIVPLTHNRYEQAFEYMFVFSKGAPKTFNPIMEECKTKGSSTKNRTFYQTSNQNAPTIGNKNVKVNDYKQKSNAWYYSKTKGIKGHPAPFPIQLANDHITTWSNEQDVILDPFMGSGTTGKMALLNNRKFIGIEKDETYFKIAQDRIAAI